MRRQLMTAVLFGTLFSACGGAAVIVEGPPPPRYAVIGVAPGPGYVWTEGYWDLHGSRWVWAPGRWLRPPRAHTVWVGSEWRREGSHWRYHRGFWR
jgi:hypothetical protein